MPSHVSGLDADSITAGDSSPFEPTVTQGMLAVAVTTALDAVSTIAGLSLAPTLVERNPFARRLFDAVGLLPGIVVASAFAIVLVVAVTEFAVHYYGDRMTDSSGTVPPIRLVGYGFPSIISLSTALHNVALLAANQVVF